MNTSAFDPATFLDATTTDANTRRPPIPQGKTLIGIIGEIRPPRETEGTKETNKGVVYHWLDIPVTFDLKQDPESHSTVGMDQVTLTHSIRLDLNQAGSLDNSPGKNNGLRQLRDALGMNTPGQPFSLRMMQGRPIRAQISWRPYQGDMYDQIESIAKAG